MLKGVNMKIILEIDKENQKVSLEPVEGQIHAEELYIAVNSFLMILAEHIKKNGGTFDDTLNSVIVMINMQLEAINKKIFNNTAKEAGVNYVN